MDSLSVRGSNDACFVNVHGASHSYQRNSVPSSAFPHMEKSRDFRKLIIELGEKLSSEELNKIKYMFSGEIKKRKMQKIASLMDLCAVLKERWLLREDNLFYLVDSLQFIKRDNLVQHVRDYAAKYDVYCNTFSSFSNFAEQVESRANHEATAQQQSFIDHSENEIGDSSEQNAQHEHITSQQSTIIADVDQSIPPTRDQETQTDTSSYSDTEMMLRLEMQELLLSGQFELTDHGQELAKFYMLRSEIGAKFLQSKLQRVYPQLLYTDIYS